MSLKLCKGLSKTPLKLNESSEVENNEKFVFTGVFTQCSVPGHVVINRNNRSYPEKTVLKHLGYLRESIKENGSLLGELDHPEGRFDIRLADASHKITDLWYDQNTHCVMGKLELLDTPNGKTAQSLVKAGYPLFVSSRAAGDVDEKTHEVEIAQIFTYDIVCTPGFAEARLERVNESVLTSDAKKYLLESVNCSKSNPLNEALNVKTRNVDIYQLNEAVRIDEKTKNAIRKPINLRDLCSPLLEEDENDFELPIAETNPNKLDEDDEDDEDEAPKHTKKINAKKDDIHEKKSDKDDDDDDDDILDSDDKEDNRNKILSISAEDEDGNTTGDEEFATSDDNEKDEKRAKILSIEGIEAETSEDDKDEDEKEENDEKVEEASKKKKKIEKETEDDIADFEAVLDSVKKAENVKESIIRRYPFAISLSESNFAKFAALRPEKKKKCNDFIVEHQIFDINSINELWTTPLHEEKRVQQNWLKLASKADIDLYVNAPIDVQNAIEESAKYVILETQEDVDDFWNKTGLRQAAARKQMNERFNSEYSTRTQKNAERENPLGYDYDYIRMTEDWYNNNNF